MWGLCNEIIDRCGCVIETNDLIDKCIDESVTRSEKEMKRYEMGELKLEMLRIERVRRGEQMKRKIIEKEREKRERIVKEIVSDLLRKIEMVKWEENRLEMREVRQEIVRLIRIDRASEKTARFRKPQTVKPEPMEVSDPVMDSEKCFNVRVRMGMDMTEVRMEVIKTENTDIIAEKDKEKRK